MSDKLKFKEDEIAETPSGDEIISDIKNDIPADIKSTTDKPAVEPEDGGETPKIDLSEKEITETAKKPAETAPSKLYEKESKLKLTKKAAVSKKSKKTFIKKRNKIYGVTDDTTDNKAVNKEPVNKIPSNSKDKLKFSKEEQQAARQDQKIGKLEHKTDKYGKKPYLKLKIIIPFSKNYENYTDKRHD